MVEEGTLSSVRRGSGYQIRYASNNPYDPDRPPHARVTMRAPWPRFSTASARRPRRSVRPAWSRRPVA
jgi:hypothetical protein